MEDDYGSSVVVVDKKVSILFVRWIIVEVLINQILLSPYIGFNPICSLDHCGRLNISQVSPSFFSFNPICSLDHCGSLNNSY